MFLKGATNFAFLPNLSWTMKLGTKLKGSMDVKNFHQIFFTKMKRHNERITEIYISLFISSLKRN